MHFLNRQCIFTCIGLGLISLGAVLAVFWMDIFRSILASELAITPGTKGYQMWKNPPLKLFFDIYLFNWTNPCNLTEADYEKPILEEIGPYRFREFPMKTKVKYHPHNFTISYRRKSTYYFDAEGSIGQLDDKIVTINTVAVSAAHTVRNWNYILQRQVSMGLNMYEQQAYVVKEARELLFDGYQDGLISIANDMSHLLPFKLEIPYDRFGWMYGRNESEDLAGHFNINTGEDHISKLGVATEWNYRNGTPYYDSPCNAVRGSGGEYYPPNQTKDKPLTFFNGELCRYLDLYFDEEKDMNGLRAFKYSANEKSVDNGTKYSEYACFQTEGETLPSGVMNVSACRYGAPVVVSFPHFYAADPYFLQFVDGLKPNKDFHEFYITMEPDTAIPIEVAARLQVNVMVKPSPNIALFQEAPVLFFPALWFEQKVTIPDEMKDDLMVASQMPIIGFICTGVLGAIGAILLISTYCCMRGQQPDHAKNMHKEELATKNGLVSEQLKRNIIEAGQPLMKDNKLLAELDVKHRRELPTAPLSVPLAVPESDFEYNEQNSVTLNHKF